MCNRLQKSLFWNAGNLYSFLLFRLHQIINVFCFRVFKSMSELWEFAHSFLSSFPPDVINGNVSDCAETHCSDIVIKKFKLSDRQPAAQVLGDLMDSLEAQNERLEVQYSSVDDYIDAAYCLEGGFSPVRSYFN